MKDKFVTLLFVEVWFQTFFFLFLGLWGCFGFVRFFLN